MKVTLPVVVLATITWAVGLIFGGLAARAIWAPRLEDCAEGHRLCSLEVTDALGLATRAVVQSEDLLVDLEEQVDEVLQLRGELDACEADQVNVFSFDDPAPSYLAPVCSADPAEVCADYEFRTEAILIEEEADALRLGLHHLRSAVALIDCAKADPEQWGDEVNMHSLEALKVMDLFISWRMVPPDGEGPTG